MKDLLRTHRQFSVAYLLGEVALIAVALAAARMTLFPWVTGMEVRAVAYCIALTCGCGATGGLILRMSVGLVAGGIFSVASIPYLCLAISTAASR